MHHKGYILKFRLNPLSSLEAALKTRIVITLFAEIFSSMYQKWLPSTYLDRKNGQILRILEFGHFNNKKKKSRHLRSGPFT